ncbi:MAG: phage tail tape measure protein, partial [Proteobacteria bacterium]
MPMNKKQVMVEIAASFHESFGSIFSTAGEKVSRLKTRVSELDSSVRSVQSLKSMTSEMGKLSDEMGKVSAKTAELKSAYESASAASESQKFKTAELTREVQRLKLEENEARKTLKSFKEEMKASGSVTDQQKNLLKLLASEQALVSREYRKAKASLSQHTAAVNADNEALNKSGTSLKHHRENLNRAETELKETTRAFDSQTLAIKKHEDALQSAGHEVKDLTLLESELSKASSKARRDLDLSTRSKRIRDKKSELRTDIFNGAAETVALGFALSQPLTIAVEFEHAMAKVGAQTKATEEEMRLLESVARKLGDTTIFSSSQAAAAQSFLGQAGFDVQQIADSLEGVLNLAAAGDTDLAETAEMASNMLAGFSLDATEMARVADLMTATFIATNTDLRDLAETMKYLAPVASGLGASIEEVAAASGLLGNIGLQGSMAGTALRAMYQRLASPPSAGAAALEELNVVTKDASNNLLSLTEILAQLDRSMTGKGTAERAAFIKDIFGEEAAAGATELLEKAGSG